MLRPRLAPPVGRFASGLVVMAMALFPVQPAGAVERIGNAIQIVRTVTGEVQADFRYLILEDPVFQNEVIATKPRRCWAAQRNHFRRTPRLITC